MKSNKYYTDLYREKQRELETENQKKTFIYFFFIERIKIYTNTRITLIRLCEPDEIPKSEIYFVYVYIYFTIPNASVRKVT
jgi:hypothetical protein